MVRVNVQKIEISLNRCFYRVFSDHLYFEDFETKTGSKNFLKVIFGISVMSSIELYMIELNR
jgi:hypothetical protein